MCDQRDLAPKCDSIALPFSPLALSPLFILCDGRYPRMEPENVAASGLLSTKEDEELARRIKRVKLKELNAAATGTTDVPIANALGTEPFVAAEELPKALDSSLKRHTALIKRMRQSIGSDNREQLLKDVDSLSLEKYIEEIASAAVEGVGRCKTEKDIWSAVEVSYL